MSDLKSSTAAFTGNLVRVKSMAVTSAVIFGCTFLPIAGGAPKPYELREFGAWINGGTTASLEQVVHPEWGGAQTIAAMDESLRETSAALVPDATAAEVEVLAGDETLEAEIMPVVHIAEAPVNACVEDCVAEAPVADDEAIAEAPDIEAVEEIAPLELG
jgi:hypothetical protein